MATQVNYACSCWATAALMASMAVSLRFMFKLANGGRARTVLGPSFSLLSAGCTSTSTCSQAPSAFEDTSPMCVNN